MSLACVICGKNTNHGEYINGKRVAVHATKCAEKLKGRNVTPEIKYCSYCKKQTLHEVTNSQTDGKGTGRSLRCVICGSSRLGEIQGFDASLM